MRISDWSSDLCSSDLDDVGSPVPVEVMLPAPAQGAIGIEVRAADSDATRLLAEINHEPTFDAVMMERALLAALGGTCRSPVAALALPQDSGFKMRAEILLPDGGETVRGEASGGRSEEHTSELQSLMRTSYAVFCLKKKNTNNK